MKAMRSAMILGMMLLGQCQRFKRKQWHQRNAAFTPGSHHGYMQKVTEEGTTITSNFSQLRLSNTSPSVATSRHKRYLLHSPDSSPPRRREPWNWRSRALLHLPEAYSSSCLLSDASEESSQPQDSLLQSGRGSFTISDASLQEEVWIRTGPVEGDGRCCVVPECEREAIIGCVRVE